MRTMVRVTVPVEAGNAGFKDGTMAKTFMNVVNQFKPESAYFTSESGERTAFFVLDIKEPSAIPSLCEPLFARLKASITLWPCMNAEDMKNGLEKMQKEL